MNCMCLGNISHNIYLGDNKTVYVIAEQIKSFQPRCLTKTLHGAEVMCAEESHSNLETRVYDMKSSSFFNLLIIPKYVRLRSTGELLCLIV